MTEETAPRSRLGVYVRLLGYLRPYPKQLIITYTAMLSAVLLNLFVPQIIKSAIDDGISSGNSAALFQAGAFILGIALVRGVAGFSQRFFGEWLTHRVAYDLRNHFYNSVQHLPFSFHDRSHTGDMMSRATSDVTETERFIGIGLMDLTATILLLIGVMIAMLLKSWQLALVALIPFPLLTYATIRFGGTVRPRFKRIQEQMGILSSMMQESMTGIRVVKAFAREPFELEKFDRENDEWFDRRYLLIKTWANNWPFFTFL
ncbi:MAG: ABC transporter ATP-binding protein, partial [Methylococcales bacterium]|nr:ABC transporter ATP-binding protein [Methylococcales bacterium]